MSKPASKTRREFLQTGVGAAVAGTASYWLANQSVAAFKSPSERPVLGCIGTGDRWRADGPAAMEFCDCVAVCDADANHAGAAKQRVAERQGKAASGRVVDVYEDYRKVLDRKDVDVVTIVTPDHWHSKIAIEAMQAGKDVYCEKPLTLTIDEGKQIIKVLDETQRVVQVGTQQRTEFGQNFLRAIALIREGRIGDVKKITCDIGASPVSGPLPIAAVPQELNWDMWLGQAPLVDYRFKAGVPRRSFAGRSPGGVRGRGGEGARGARGGGARRGRGARRGGPAMTRAQTRCHYEFRWWYEYSGGKLTDWGAHHVDIAQWAIGQNGPGQGVVRVEPVMAKHPVTLHNGQPVEDDRYNTATDFHIRCTFTNGVELNIVSQSPDGNGILFEGTQGRFHVSRRRLKGKPIEDLESNPLPEDAIAAVYGGQEPTSHMRNFCECVQSRKQPISDVYSHHRALTTCHLANIAIRLGRTLNWDPKSQEIVGDAEANQWQARQQRKGYEINT